MYRRYTYSFSPAHLTIWASQSSDELHLKGAESRKLLSAKESYKRGQGLP